MSAALIWLASLDAAVVVGALLCFVGFLLALPGLIVRLGETERTESLSERHERLDAEARRWSA